MSKQSEARTAQNYRLIPDTCGNCRHYRSKIVEKTYDGWNGKQVWTEEKDRRCALGEFVVRKTAICDRHESIPNA